MPRRVGFYRLFGRDQGPKRTILGVAVATASMACALALTHVLWRAVQYTPFLLAFAAVIVSTRVGGRTTGLLAVLIGIIGYSWFPPPLPAAGFGRLLVGFSLVSATFSWLVARRDDIEIDLRASQALAQRSERRLQAIIDAEPACVKIVSRDGLLLDMNRAGLDLVGADELSQLAGRSIVDLVHPEDRSRYLERHRAALDGTPGRLEFRVTGLKGEERWVDSRAVPFDPSIAGSRPGRAVLSVSSDTTDRKRLEAAVAGAQRMEAIGRLAGGISHDFNNVLTAISGFTDLVLHTLEETDPRRTDLLEVQKAAARAGALTHQLLALSRRQVLQPRVLDLNALVANVEKLLHRTIGEDIDLMLSFDPSLEPVLADPSQLEQVLLNLAVNARDAMPQGGQLRFLTEMVELEPVAAHERTPMLPGRYVRLTVTDTGVGIPADVAPHVFEPFFTTKGQKGTGLGLATVYGIVKQSGGFVWVTSQVGMGTSVEIDLPSVQEDVEPLFRLTQPAPALGGVETILIAEDDGAVRRLARTVLGQHGYTVLEARDGDEALQLALTDPHRHVDLLIADIVMPGLSGHELAAELASVRPTMRVLYTTGYAESLMHARTDADLPFLAKPFLPEDLLRLVRQKLDKAASPHDSQG